MGTERAWRRRIWLKRLAGATVAGVLALAFCEAVVRTCFPIYYSAVASSRVYDSQLGYTIRKGYHRFEVTDHLKETRTNEQGTVNFQDDFDGSLLVVSKRANGLEPSTFSLEG